MLGRAFRTERWQLLLLLAAALLPASQSSFVPSPHFALPAPRPPCGLGPPGPRRGICPLQAAGSRQNMGKKARDMNVLELQEELRETYGVETQSGDKRADLVARLQRLRDPRSRQPSGAKGPPGREPRRGNGGGGRGPDPAAEKSWSRFRGYYEEQLAATMGREALDEMFEALLRPLPITFRVSEARGVGGGEGGGGAVQRESEVTRRVAELLGQGVGKGDSDAKKSEGVLKQLTWYPNGAAWQLDLAPMEMREGRYRKLQAWLVAESEAGRIWRQEAVSMLPVLLLHPRPGMAVLDMCAAPGSKTSQLLEGVSAPRPGEEGRGGAVVANDADVARAQMMVHRCKALRSPSLLVTSYEGQRFPRLSAPVPTGEAGGGWRGVAFDAVLCDVPCSGDGTLRKYVAQRGQVAPKMRWHPDRGNRMHALQLGILERGLDLARVGGLIAYSTCSLNPVENEAVVAAVLQQHGGEVELEDACGELRARGLKVQPGIGEWRVADKNDEGVLYRAFEEVPEGRKARDRSRGGGDGDATRGEGAVEERRGLHRTMFAPEGGGGGSLQRCARILPHSQDTGGFFIALFRKRAPIDSLRFSEPGSAGGDGGGDCGEGDGDVGEGGTASYFDVGEVEGGREVLDGIREFYQLSRGFPESQLVARSTKMSQIRFVSPEVASLARARDSGGGRIRVSTAGILAFQNKRWEQDMVRHRLCMEGLGAVGPWMGGRRRLRLPLDLFAELLSARDLPLDRVPGAGSLEVGTFVCTLDTGRSDGGARDPWALVCWRGGHKVLVFADRGETEALANSLREAKMGTGKDG